jgi:hypothetical protein
MCRNCAHCGHSVKTFHKIFQKEELHGKRNLLELWLVRDGETASGFKISKQGSEYLSPMYADLDP